MEGLILASNQESPETGFHIFHPGIPGDRCDVPPGTILLGLRGSSAHGMYVPASDPNSIDDIDLMGFVIPEKKYYLGLSEWGSRGTKDFWQGQYDCVFYELRKAFSLLLQGNPNIISLLWLEQRHYLYRTVEGKNLVDHRDIFVGKHVYNAFAGYAHGQMEKMVSRNPHQLKIYMDVTNELKRRGIHPNHKGEIIQPPDDHSDTYKGWSKGLLIETLSQYHKKGENIGYMGDKRKQLVLEHGYDCKNAAHCVRLLKMCKEFLADGVMRVYRTHDREELLEIKRGKWTLAEVKEYCETLFAEIKVAKDKSPLPDGPNRELAEGLLIRLVNARLELGERTCPMTA